MADAVGIFEPGMDAAARRSRAETIIHHSQNSRRHIASALNMDRVQQGSLANVLCGAIRHFDVDAMIDLAEYMDDVLQSRIATAREYSLSSSPPAQPTTAVNPPTSDGKASKGKKDSAVGEAIK